MAAMETANSHHGQQQPYPSLPASPTLTNPDMILPDYDRADSPDSDVVPRDHSPLMMWKNAHTASGDLQQMFAMTTPGQQRVDHPYGPTAPITPTTPIIYGNGTMLSDIGEVTEVESTPGKPSPSRYRGAMRRLESPTRGAGAEDVLRSSPTMGMEAIMKKKSKQSIKKERRASTDSTSTITTQDQAHFADFDDSISVVDSVFQADDEESVASSYVEGNQAREPGRLGIPNTDNADRLSTYSTTSLSKRAEEILANAKKRLTTMEGNLTRARDTLYSPTLDSDGSTPSPPFQRALTALNTRDNDPSSPSSSPGHARQSSDIALRNGLPYRVSPRSQSALGAAGGYRQPLTSSKSVDHIRGSLEGDNPRPVYKITPPNGLNGLAPLSEDDATDSLLRTSTGARLEQFLSPTFGTFSGNSSDAGGRGLQRPASTTQMRDLKDQMKDLKGKISSLREQARADSMKRRSLQSLRTPSPFTHSQISQWYAEPKSNRSSAVVSPNEPTSRNPWNGELSSVDGDEPAADGKGFVEDDESVYSEVEATRTQLRPADHSPERKPIADPVAMGEEPGLEYQGGGEEDDDDISDMLTENGDMEEDLPAGFQVVQDLGLDYDSESGDSMYHDAEQHPISHEDREDAFDYEHFFLHSAMGSMSQRRRDSFSSEGSVETTRGPIVENEGNEESRSRSRRRNSDASVSTVETFATADEERSNKSNGSGSTRASLEDVREQVLEVSDKSRSESPETARRASFGPGTFPANASGTVKTRETNRYSDGSISPIPEEGKENEQTVFRQRPSVARRPMSSSAAVTSMRHRPSVSSFESTGTNRSFPLVNKPIQASSTGVLTPNSSPDQELRNISDTLLNETASICEQQSHGGGIRNDIRGHIKAGSTSSLGSVRLANGPPAMHTLLREDQYLVERLVASLGRCVLGLTESGRASTESRMYRRRIEAARKLLEGLEADSPSPV